VSGLPLRAVFDFDGTLTTARWPRFSGPDEPENVPVCALARALATGGVGVVVLSGRPAAQRVDVEAWLRTHGVEPWAVVLRPTGDDGPGAVARWKGDQLARLQTDGTIVLFADDRPEARANAARLGVPTLDPDTGDPAP